MWGGRWEEGSCLGTHVHPWWIRVDVWQNQYSIVKLKNKINILCLIPAYEAVKKHHGRWEGGSGLGTHVHPWQIHVNVWQNQYSIVKQKKVKKKKLTFQTLYV